MSGSPSVVEYTILSAACQIRAKSSETGGWPGVLLLPAVVTTTLACWGFRGFLPAGPPFGLLVLSPQHWQALVLVPVVGVVTGFIGLRLYDRLRRRGAAIARRDHPVSPRPD